MSRNSHFEEGHGDITVGYNTGEGAVCKNCASTNPEYADVNPRSATKIRLSHVGEGSDAYPDGFTCDGCGETVGAWDYKGDR